MSEDSTLSTLKRLDPAMGRAFALLPAEVAQRVEDICAVPRAASVRRRRLSKGTVWVVVGVAVLAAGAAGIAASFDLLQQRSDFHARYGAGIDPARTGDYLDLADDGGYELIAWPSKAGLCIDVAVNGNGANVCGLALRGAPTADPTAAVSDLRALFSNGLSSPNASVVGGLVSSRVARVQVTLTTGDAESARLVDTPDQLGANTRAFLTVVPDGARVSAVAAYDAAGALVAEQHG